MRKKIVVRIGKDGKAKVSAYGFSGQSCLDVSKAIEEAMGVIQDRSYTEEFYAIERGVEQVKQGQ